MQPFVPRPVPLGHRQPVTPAPAASAVPPAEQGTRIASENTSVPPSAEPQTATASSSEAAATTVEVQVSQSPPYILQPPSLHALAQASSYFTSLPFPSLQNVNMTMNLKKRMTAQLKKALHAKTTTSSVQHSDVSAPGFPKPPSSARTVLNSSASSPKKLGRTSKSRRAPPQLLASDARAEHLLIAARRLGRERAGIVAGVISAERERMEREKAEQEKERIEREKERIEREKRNRDGGGYYRERPAPVRRGSIEHGTPKRDESTEGTSTQYANALAGYVSAAAMPAKTDVKGKGKSVQAPPTPLDSLLDAARSMEQDENGAEPSSAISASTGMMTRRRGRAANANVNVNEPAGAPPSKRRRLSSNTSDSPNRVRTALDVLADQAAAFGGSDVPPGKGKGKGKEKGVADQMAANAVPPVKRKRGRPPNKDRHKPPPAVASMSKLISPTAVAGPSNAAADTLGTVNISGSVGEHTTNSRPATRWVQRGRLTASASSRAPPRQMNDVESEDEDGAQGGEPVQTKKVAETEPEPQPHPVADEPMSTETVVDPEPQLEPQAQTKPPDNEQGDAPVIRPTAIVTPRPALVPATPNPQPDAEPVVSHNLDPLAVVEIAPLGQAGSVEAGSVRSPSMLEDSTLFVVTKTVPANADTIPTGTEDPVLDAVVETVTASEDAMSINGEVDSAVHDVVVVAVPANQGAIPTEAARAPASMLEYAVKTVSTDREAILTTSGDVVLNTSVEVVPASHGAILATTTSDSVLPTLEDDVVVEAVPASQDAISNVPSMPVIVEDAVDADADGESDPDVDMDATSDLV
ncbi:hypothetical protein B0H12DRAFT_717051 [Mycena haematopus]|nr:hypothetical protein B0H12DRAFT_717051 [Mycena haematopus]